MENSKFNQGTVQGRPGLNSLGRRTPPNSHKTNAFIGERIFQSQCLSDHNKNEELFSSFTTQIKATPCSGLQKKVEGGGGGGSSSLDGGGGKHGGGAKAGGEPQTDTSGDQSDPSA